MTASALVGTKSPAQVRAGTYVGLFLITLSTLMYEIALTRIFSVTMWYHFAFVAISVALFGMTAGALSVHLLPKVFDKVNVKRHLWIYSLAFSIDIAACFLTQLQIRFNPVFASSQLTRTSEKASMAPTDRSKAPARSGISNARARMPTTTWSAATSLNVVSVRNVSGIQSPNRTKMNASR